ncbi:glycosyltransferase family 2 protein [Pseudomonas quasicaspiana]|uniref:glycosyltransferase family 2 protein n=1 Tax=Pseudomonas quasicaspiana TaxID=2829821 RepID=UPI001E62B95E|nr:glycosyltransferase family 2 protein [Pseudomonas quasicaspiana]MCD5970844.1 glycosyltransferase [Pseudomonas quasicaspiana]MCD5979442.1 glycosyltransferase [Pseudomonas quasicaspiana]
MTHIAIVLPAYNEELTVAATIEDFFQQLPNASVWVINNRSTDATEQIARETLQRLRCVGGVVNESRPGKGNAVRRALLDIDADVYVLADADLTYPASDVHALLRPVLAGDADMVVGDRHSQGQYAAENKRALHGFGNRLVRGLVNRLFGANLADIMSGYRVFNRRFVKSYPILVEGFEIETDMTLHALDKRFRIVEIPSDYRDRPDGSFSKLNTVKDGVRVVSTIWNILRYYRPMLFFGGCAAIFALMGLIAAMPVISDWLREQYIYHVPLAILATGLELVAVAFGSIGLILDSISQQDRRHFELELLRMTHPACVQSEQPDFAAAEPLPLGVIDATSENNVRSSL